MNRIWRFYQDADGRWRWQHLGFNGDVIAESRSGYEAYETCLSNARDEGYVYQPSLSTRTHTTLTRRDYGYLWRR